MSDESENTPTTDDVTIVAATVADQEGILAEGAVAIQGDHALVVARFADTGSARALYDDLLMAEIDGSLHIDSVLVVKADDDGKLHVEKMTDHSTRTGLKWGIVGGVVAAVFLPATIVAGAVALGAAGAAAGKARNLAHRLDVEQELAGVITPGTSGILALVTAEDAPAVEAKAAERRGGQDGLRRRRDGRRGQGSRGHGRGDRPVRQLVPGGSPPHDATRARTGHGPGSFVSGPCVRRKVGPSALRRMHARSPADRRSPPGWPVACVRRNDVTISWIKRCIRCIDLTWSGSLEGPRRRCMRLTQSRRPLRDPGGRSEARRRQGTTPSISTSSEKLRNVRTRTISPSVAALSSVWSMATVRMMSAMIRTSRPSRIVRPRLWRRAV